MVEARWPLQVYFDGACPICSREVGYARKRDGLGRIAWVDISAPGFDAEAIGLDGKRLMQSLHARGPDGRVYEGVEAAVRIMRCLQRSPLTGMALGVLKVPGMMWVARGYYRWFAKNRLRLTGRCTAESCAADVSGK